MSNCASDKRELVTKAAYQPLYAFRCELLKASFGPADKTTAVRELRRDFDGNREDRDDEVGIESLEVDRSKECVTPGEFIP